MISEESCDTEDWSNDAEYSTLSKDILKYITNKVILNCKNNSQYYCFYSIFLSNKCKLNIARVPIIFAITI